MRNKRFTLGLIAVAMAGVLLLSGCVTIRSEATINSDLSGTRTIILAMDKSMMDLAQSGGEGTPSATPSDPFEDVKESAGKIPGATVEPYSDTASGRSGVQITVPFSNLDEFAKMDLGGDKEEDKNLDTVEWSQDGDLVTLNIALNVESVSNQASGTDPSSKPSTPEEQAMAQQMMAAMGLEYTYSLALPGEIVEYSPMDNATFDAATNKITWTVDFAKAATAAPNLMVKWDNSKAPAGALPVDSSAKATPPSKAETVSATGSMLAALQAYAESVTNQDQAAYAALMAGDVINHPLVDQFPDLFGASNDMSVIYTGLAANETTGMAEWAAQWTRNDESVSLSGVDIVTFDAKGKVTGIKVYVEPSEWTALRGTTE